MHSHHLEQGPSTAQDAARFPYTLPGSPELGQEEDGVPGIRRQDRCGAPVSLYSRRCPTVSASDSPARTKRMPRALPGDRDREYCAACCHLSSLAATLAKRMYANA